MSKKNFAPYFRPKQKINSSCIIGLNLKGKTNFLEEYIEHFLNVRVGKSFIKEMQKSLTIKEIIN